jgi:hypothetical protein
MKNINQGIEDGYLQNNLDAKGNKITNLGAPTDPNDAAPKTYVDSVTGSTGGVIGIGLHFQDVFTSPTTFTTDGAGTWTGNATLITQPPQSILGNSSTVSDVPAFLPPSTTKQMLSLDQVNNTTDANKPISTAQATVNTSVSSSLSAHTTAITNLQNQTLDVVPKAAADVDLNHFKIINLANPIGNNDATPKQYVDSVAAGGPPHPAAVVASTANLTLSGEQTIDGITTSASRILVKDQTSQPTNGIYVTASGAWSRASDANTNTSISGIIFVTGGTANGGITYGLTTPQPIILGTTNLVYTLTGKGTTYTASGGITLSAANFQLSNMAANTVKGNSTTGSAAPSDNACTALGFNVLASSNSSGANAFVTIASNNAVTLRSASNFVSDIGAGTVSSVDLGTNPNGNNATDLLALTWSTKTSTPRLQVDKATVSPNTIYGNSTGGTAVPTFMSASTAKSVIGAESPLTFNTPLNRQAGTNTVTIPKVAVSPAVVDGFLAGSDYLSLLNSTPSPFVIIGNGPFTITSTANPRTSRILVTVPFSVRCDITLPLANSYNSVVNYQFIEIIDISPNGYAVNGFGIRLVALSASPNNNTIDGQPFIDLPKGMGYLRINSDTNTKWTSTKYYVDSFKNPLDQTQQVKVQFPAGFSGQHNLTLGNGDSVTVVPTSGSGVVKSINSDGSVTQSAIAPTDLVPQYYDVVGVNGVIASGSVFQVTTGGSIDTVRIKDQLSGPITLQWPKCNDYSPAESVALFDYSGSVSSTNSVTITSIDTGTPDNFNGQSSAVFNEANGRKVLTSDNQNPGRWSVSLTKAGVQGFQTLTPATNIFTLLADVNAVKQNAIIPLVNGNNFLQINNVQDGMEFDFIISQPSSGSPAGSLLLPVGSNVATSTGNGLGLITLSSSASAVDRVHGSYVGAAQSYYWDSPILNYTNATLPAAPSLLTAGSFTSSKVPMSWQDNANNEQGFVVERRIASGPFSVYATIPGVSSGTGGTVNYTDNGVTPSTAYSYRVSAYNTAGNSASPSNVITVTTLAGGKTADLWQVQFNENAGTQPSAAVPSGGLVDLTYADWTTATQHSAAAYNPIAGMGQVTSAGATVSVGGGSASYSYRILGWKTGGTKHNAAVTVTTPATQVLTLDGTNYNTISWSAPTMGSADYYEVYRSTVPAGSNVATGKITNQLVGTSVNDTGQAQSGAIPGGYQSATDVHTATAHAPIAFATNIITISFWIKSSFPNSVATAQNVIGCGANSWQIRYTNLNRWNITFPGGTGGTCTATIPNNSTTNGSAFNSGTDWHHMAVILSSTTAHTTSDIQVFYDGGTSPGITPTVTYTFGTNTGALTFPTVAPVIGSLNFAGAIDDVRIFTGALSGSDILGLFQGNAQ